MWGTVRVCVGTVTVCVGDCDSLCGGGGAGGLLEFV